MNQEFEASMNHNLMLLCNLMFFYENQHLLFLGYEPMSKLVLTVPALLHEIVVVGLNLYGGHIGRVAYGVLGYG